MNALARMLCVSASISIGLAVSANEARALSYHITELSSCPTTATGEVDCVGAVVTIGFWIELDRSESILGFSASAYGYDESVVDFESGLGTHMLFSSGIPAVGSFDGIPNALAGRRREPVPLAESSIGTSANRVQIFTGSDVGRRSIIGIPSVYRVSDSGAWPGTEFLLRFRGVGSGTATIDFGTGLEGDAAVFADRRVVRSVGLRIVWNDDAQPYVVPEPGTGYLIGLGLLLLSGRGTRRRDEPHDRRA